MFGKKKVVDNQRYFNQQVVDRLIEYMGREELESARVFTYEPIGEFYIYAQKDNCKGCVNFIFDGPEVNFSPDAIEDCILAALKDLLSIIEGEQYKQNFYTNYLDKP